MTDRQRVTVVGGGLIGLCTAWNLQRLGATVTVVDRDGVGAATSAGNTGWVVPALSAPVAAPGSVTQGRQMLLRRDNPFRIRPRLDPHLATWLAAFMRSARPEQFRRGSAAILALNERTLERFDELAVAGVDFEMHDGGIVFLCRSEPVLAGTRARFDALGYPGEIEPLDADAARALEPSIGEIHGALHIKPERVVRPETLVAGLRAALERGGAAIREHAPASAIRPRGATWVVDVPGAEIEGDAVVVAAGIWSNELRRSIGMRLPLQPGKGYSLTTDGSGRPPARALFFVEAMVGAAPYEGTTRLAGMLELAGMDPRIDPRRIGLLRAAARGYLDGWDPGDAGTPWAGLRPMTPDGLPIVGAVPRRDGLFLATGHGMVGLTLAPSTGALLAPLVLEGREAPELGPLSPSRF